MKRRELVVLGLVLVQAPVFFFLHRAHLKANAQVIKPPKLLTVSQQALIGDEADLTGNRSAHFTLVEFGDYQCPGCAQRQAQVNFLLSEFPLELRFGFHHYPLPNHRNAMPCALIAEEARAEGRFWEVHNALYDMKSKVSPDRVAAMQKTMHLDFTSLSEKQQLNARKRIEADIKLGDACNLEETPTFILCSPDGRVQKLGDLSQMETLLATK